MTFQSLRRIENIPGPSADGQTNILDYPSLAYKIHSDAKAWRCRRSAQQVSGSDNISALLRTTQLRFFNKSRISISNFSSFVGSGGAGGAGGGASCLNRFTCLTNIKMTKAIMMKSNTLCKKTP